MAGDIDRALGICRGWCGRRRRRIAHRRYHQRASGLSPTKRSAVQRRRHRHRILRRCRAPVGRTGADRHDRRRGSAVPPAAVYRQLTLQERSGWFQMGSESVHGNMVNTFGPAKSGPYVRSPKAGPYARSPKAGPYVRSPKAGPYVLWLVLFAFALVPRTSYGQVDVTGSWVATGAEDLAGDSVPVDYTGVPLNQEGRIRALSYNESQYSMIERQCQGLPVFYFVQGPFGIRIWNTT